MTSNILRHPIWSCVTRIEVLLFLALWLSYGVLITAKNVEDFGQNQATVEAIVDQHRFSIEDLPNWQVSGDYFGYNERRYMNKQPGQGMVGAVAYAHLRLFGFSYTWDKLFTGALVVFFSASLLTAFAGVVVFRFARELDHRRSTFWPLASALAFGWGTIAFAYAGIAHHDAIAAAFLIAGFYLIFLLRADPRPDRDRIRIFGAGLLLGLTLTTSMNPFFMAVVVGIYFLSLKKWNLIGPMLIGGIVGVLPMLIYNTINFGNPLTLPMSLYIPHPSDSVFFSYDWTNFVEKITYYFRDTNWYGPVLWFGLAGLVFLAVKRQREALTIAAAIVILVFYVSNIQSLGTCNYGPRYVLAAMPFASLGIVGLHNVPTKPLRWLVGLALVFVGLISIWINFVGAVGGAMFCNLSLYAYSGYYADIMSGKWPHFLLLPWLLPLVAGFVALLVLKPFVPARVEETPEEAPEENFEETLEENTMSTADPKPNSNVEDEDLGLLEFIKGHKIPMIILAIVGLAILYPVYSVLFPAAKVSPPAAVTPPTVAATPESTDPVNAFEGGQGKAPGRFLNPRGMASDSTGNIYVADTDNARIQKFDPAGNSILSFATNVNGDNPVSKPIGIAVDKSGNIFVTDLGNGTLIKFAADGKFIKEWKGPDPGFYGPVDMAVGPNGNLYIVDSGRLRIVQFDPGSESFTAWGTLGSGPGQFKGSTGIGIGAGEVYVADLGNDRVQAFDLNGVFLREWAVPVWEKYPWHYPDVVVDEVSKTVYLTNGWANEILAFDPAGNSVKGEIPADAVATMSNPSSLIITELKKERRIIALNTQGSKLSSFNLQPGTRK